MVLYQSSLITLEYDPATDILSVDWPDVQQLYVAAVSLEINELVKNIKHYDVKKLLIDTSKAKINVNDAEYQAFLVGFADELAGTRLQKVARVGTTDPAREKLVNQTREIAQFGESLEFRIFSTKAEAMAWLLE